MVKAYLRYVSDKTLGLISTNKSNIKLSRDERFIYTGSNEFVVKIDWRKSQQTQKYSPATVNQSQDEGDFHAKVTYINNFKGNDSIIVGYDNGGVMQFDSQTGEILNKFWFHKSQVTCICVQSKQENIVASSSLDTSIFVYDLISNVMTHKLKGHSNAVHKIFFCDFFNQRGHLISAGKDNLIKDGISEIQYIQEQQLLLIGSGFSKKIKILKIYHKTDDDVKSPQIIKVGEIKRKEGEKVNQLVYSNQSNILICSGSSQNIQMWRIASNKQLQRRLLLSKRRSKKKEKAAKQGSKNDQEDKVQVQEEEEKQTKVSVKLDKKQIEKDIRSGDYDHGYLFLSLIFKQHQSSQDKITSLAIQRFKQNQTFVYISYSTNKLKQFLINHLELEDNQEHDKKLDKFFTQTKQINSRQAHSTPIRNMSISQNDRYLVSASNQCVKVWQLETFTAIHDIRAKHITSTCIFSNKKQAFYILCGTRSGELILYNLETAQSIFNQKHAHHKEIWSISYHSAPQCYKSSTPKILTASADATLKLWSIQFEQKKKSKKSQQSTINSVVAINLVESINIDEQATFAEFSPNGKYLVASLLDNSIRILYADSKKQFLKLYAHKLPVLSFDISSDQALLVSGSADKNIKLWGMDFGDVHKSIFAHDDAITSVKFVKDTHYFFSTSKDGLVKFFDGDTYEQVMRFQHHFAEVWQVAISSIGDQFITCSSDRSLRVFKQTDEQVFVKLEQRKREGIQNLRDTLHLVQQIKQKKDEMAITTEIVKYGEGLIDALNKAEALRFQIEAYKIGVQDAKIRKQVAAMSVPTIPLEFNGRDIFSYVLSRFEQIKVGEIESALNYLNFSDVKKLLFYLQHFIRKRKGDVGKVLKGLIFILKEYEEEIQGSKSLAQIILSIHVHLQKRLEQIRVYVLILNNFLFQEIAGFNQVMLKLLQKRFREKQRELMNQ